MRWASVCSALVFRLFQFLNGAEQSEVPNAVMPDMYDHPTSTYVIGCKKKTYTEAAPSIASKHGFRLLPPTPWRLKGQV